MFKFFNFLTLLSLSSVFFFFKNFTFLLVFLIYCFLILLFFFSKNYFSTVSYGFLSRTVIFFLATLIFSLLNLMVFKDFFHLSGCFFKSLEWVNYTYFSFCFDNLSVFFLTVVLVISFFTVLFQNSYTFDFLQKERFFIQLNFFVISMVFLVISKHWFLLLISWECLGISSFFLINFFKQKTSVFKSSFKAFFFNKISDLFLILSCVFYYKNTNTFFLENFFFFKQKGFGNFFVFLILASLIKSAQFIFFFWLPDSMEAPVPASALIHSATLVSAGIYLLLRFRFFFYNNGFLQEVLKLSSIFSFIFFSFISSTQSDLKKLLAFSTISNCAFIFFLISLKDYKSSLFFFSTHGFLKSFCFLLLGFFIVKNKHKQDLKNWKFHYMDSGYKNILYCQFLSLGGLPLGVFYFLKSNILVYNNVWVFEIYSIYFFLFFYTFFSYCYSLKILVIVNKSFVKKTKTVAYNKNLSLVSLFYFIFYFVFTLFFFKQCFLIEQSFFTLFNFIFYFIFFIFFYFFKKIKRALFVFFFLLFCIFSVF